MNSKNSRAFPAWAVGQFDGLFTERTAGPQRPYDGTDRSCELSKHLLVGAILPLV